MPRFIVPLLLVLTLVALGLPGHGAWAGDKPLPLPIAGPAPASEPVTEAPLVASEPQSDSKGDSQGVSQRDSQGDLQGGSQNEPQITPQIKPPSLSVGAQTETAKQTESAQQARSPVWVAPSSVGKPWPRARAKGLLAFRGNPTRSYYGKGPLPDRPAIAWRRGPYCGVSSVGQETKSWCGSGWTGQPVVWQREERTEVIQGAYDHAVHFFDSVSGQDLRPPLATDDIIKGSVSLDPDGYPLIYFGSRDNFLRIAALDGESARVLWKLPGRTAGAVWNNDWDGNPLIINDYMLVGGENSLFYIVKLNRHWLNGSVNVNPKIVSKIKGYTPELFRLVRDRMVSIEASVAVWQDRVYFSNSGGLVQGYDIGKLIGGASRDEAQVFEFWTGDDTDATLVIDQAGMIYVASEKERPDNAGHARAGQLARLNPFRPDQPVDWKLDFPKAGEKYGLWATPALYEGYLYVVAHTGDFWVVDSATGEVTFREKLSYHSWSSPVVVEDQLLVADCRGRLARYDLSQPANPRLVWRMQIPSGGCIESTPAVWDGGIYVGNRDGYIYAIKEAQAGQTPLAGPVGSPAGSPGAPTRAEDKPLIIPEFL